ncbi:unnamed protein product [Phaedon cochleariae]|uniref:Prominin-like protein n=1 Tax=Phaedon cochleariae TaxID=80249 RepID=A0A9P0DXE2_PHACE|nr:unnamed protein product [Phaedon cochleariae]
MARSKSKSANAGRDTRRSTNILILLATFAILFVAVDLTDGSFANSIDKINRNLEVALRDLGENMPDYSNYSDAQVYLSTNATFNPSAMAGLYNLTRRFIDWIGKDILMNDLVVYDKTDHPQINSNITIGQIFKYYWGLITVIILVAVITIFLPLCGLFFCCCRCCGNCGSRPQPCDKKRDLCSKVIQGTLLILLGTAMLFCVVCAFASNQQLQDGVDEFPKNIEVAKSDSIAYLNSTRSQATSLCVTNYQEFADVFKNTIQESGLHVMQQLTIWSNATAMMDLCTFINITIPNVSENLRILKDDTNNLRASASQLNDAMRKVKKDLLNTLQICSLEDCNEIKNKIAKLQTNIDFNKIPDVKPTIEELDKFNTKEMRDAAVEGMNKLDKIESDIKNKLNTTLGDAIHQVDKAGDEIKKYASNVTDLISDIQKTIKDINTATVHDYIKNYGPYRYYGSIAISCILLSVTVCIALGLICGICGKRPDGYSDNCCNKGAGNQFLMCAVTLMFISSIVIGVVTLITMVIGLTTDRVVCDTIKNPSSSTVMELLERVAKQQLSNSDFNVSLGSVLEKCYRNDSIYNVLNLKDKFDIDTIKQNFNVSKFLDDMKSQLDKIVGKDFVILDPTNEATLKNLADLKVGIDFDKFQEELKDNFTNFSLNYISSELEKLTKQMEDERFDNMRHEIQLSILHINTYDEKILVPMKDTAKKVMVIAKQLDTDLKMNSTSFADAINKMISEIKDAQEKLRTDGDKILREATTAFGAIVEKQVNSYLDRVTHVIQNELGQCGPISTVLNATLVATCDKIILPWNGFWFTLLISVLLFIPTIIVSVKLASLYKKYKQYGPYVETTSCIPREDRERSEYLYDAYADRGDSIPLNSRGGKRGGKKKKGKKSDDRPQNMGGEVVAREYTAASHPSDSRYADMAPKNWEEFPNGGPPQYQRAPTEYERPPPYYYPGTADQ